MQTLASGTQLYCTDGTNALIPKSVAGKDGSTILVGNGAPSGSLGRDGDLYADESTQNVFKKANGSWTFMFNAKGSKGDQGVQGVAGSSCKVTSTSSNAATIVCTDGTSAVIAGVKGDRGEQGIQGVAGVKGDRGSDGVKGDRGEQGVQGVSGNAGPKGDQGIQGVAGEKGERGANILVGSGSPGQPTGMNGDTWFDSLTANFWQKVNNAWVFVRNLIGPKGEKGDRGEQGIQGVAGAKGDRGDQGIQGVAGVKGDRGEQGIQGAVGLSGSKGEQGLTGAAGVKGEKGDRGDQGIAGVKGEAGRNGVDATSPWQNTSVILHARKTYSSPVVYVNEKNKALKNISAQIPFSLNVTYGSGQNDCAYIRFDDMICKYWATGNGGSTNSTHEEGENYFFSHCRQINKSILGASSTYNRLEIAFYHSSSTDLSTTANGSKPDTWTDRVDANEEVEIGIGDGDYRSGHTIIESALTTKSRD